MGLAVRAAIVLSSDDNDQFFTRNMITQAAAGAQFGAGSAGAHVVVLLREGQSTAVWRKVNSPVTSSAKGVGAVHYQFAESGELEAGNVFGNMRMMP